MTGPAITPETKVGDLLDAYPEIEETLIAIAPKFKALKNPVLRRTVAKVASLEQAARVADIPVNELVRVLREALGQPTGDIETGGGAEEEGEAPGWVGGEVLHEFDADAMLARGETPVGKVTETMAGLDPGGVVLIRSTFQVAPLIDALRGKGHEVFNRKVGEEAWEAWVLKQTQ